MVLSKLCIFRMPLPKPLLLSSEVEKIRFWTRYKPNKRMSNVTMCEIFNQLRLMCQNKTIYFSISKNR